MKKLFLFFISLFFGLFLQNAFSMRFPNEYKKSEKQPPADVSKSCDLDDEEDAEEGTENILECLADDGGKQAYENAFSVLSGIIGSALSMRHVSPGVWEYFLKKDISVEDFKKIQDAFGLIKGDVKKSFNVFKSKKCFFEKIPVLTITLNEKFSWYKD